MTVIKKFSKEINFCDFLREYLLITTKVSKQNVLVINAKKTHWYLIFKSFIS